MKGSITDICIYIYRIAAPGTERTECLWRLKRPGFRVESLELRCFIGCRFRV